MSDIFTAENILFMLKGAGYSLLLALGAIAIGCVIGVLIAAAKLSQSKSIGSTLLRWIANIYVELFRGTPMLLQILFFYLGVPVLYQRITGMRLSVNPYVVGILALSFNSGAYQAELIRSGIQGVDKGQWEACATLGIGYGTMMKEVILPQAFKRIVPPLVSEFITLIKDSSLISNIGALELLYSAQVLGKKYYDYLDPLILAGIMYLFMTVITSYLSKRVERRFAVND
jgi:polar amino acid transport system permease protein